MNFDFECVLQDIINVSGKEDRFRSLLGLVQNNEGKLVVFFNRRVTLSKVANRLTKQGIPLIRVSDTKKGSAQRIEEFESGPTNLLLTTDAAIKRLEISKIKFVVNYELPKKIAIYVARIKRIDSDLKLGEVYTFLEE